MIRDRLVVGILDQALSERMQTDSELSLEKARTMVRQKASVKEQCSNKTVRLPLKEFVPDRLQGEVNMGNPPSALVVV